MHGASNAGADSLVSASDSRADAATTSVPAAAAAASRGRPHTAPSPSFKAGYMKRRQQSKVYYSQKLPHLKLEVREPPFDKAVATEELLRSVFGSFILWKQSRSAIVLSYHSRQVDAAEAARAEEAQSSAHLNLALAQRAGSLLVADLNESQQVGSATGKSSSIGSVKHLKIFITTLYCNHRIEHAYKLETRPNRTFDDLASLIATLPFLNIRKVPGGRAASRGSGKAKANGKREGQGSMNEGGADSKDASVFPAWLARRKDFQASFPRFTMTHNSVDAATLMALTKFRGFREPDDVNLLVRWMKKFTSLDLTKVYTLCTVADHMYLGAGRVLFRAGDTAEYFYMVFSGVVQVELGHDVHAVLATMKQGDGFGEKGLATQSKRMATVRAQTNTHLIRIARPDYMTSLLIYHRARRRRLMHWLRHSTRGLLRHWSRQRLFNLAEASTEKTFERNDVVVSQGDTSVACMFFVKSGELQIQKEVISVSALRRPIPGRQWEEVQHSAMKLIPVGTLRAGDVFGTEAVVHLANNVSAAANANAAATNTSTNAGTNEDSTEDADAGASAGDDFNAADTAATKSSSALRAWIPPTDLARAYTVVCKSQRVELVMVLGTAFRIFEQQGTTLQALCADMARREKAVDALQTTQRQLTWTRRQLALQRGPKAVRGRSEVGHNAERAARDAGVPGGAQLRRHRAAKASQPGQAALLRTGTIRRVGLKKQIARTDRDGIILEWHEKLLCGENSTFEGIRCRTEAEISDAVKRVNKSIAMRRCTRGLRLHTEAGRTAAGIHDKASVETSIDAKSKTKAMTKVKTTTKLKTRPASAAATSVSVSAPAPAAVAVADAGTDTTCSRPQGTLRTSNSATPRPCKGARPSRRKPSSSLVRPDIGTASQPVRRPSMSMVHSRHQELAEAVVRSDSRSSADAKIVPEVEVGQDEQEVKELHELTRQAVERRVSTTLAVRVLMSHAQDSPRSEPRDEPRANGNGVRSGAVRPHTADARLLPPHGHGASQSLCISPMERMGMYDVIHARRSHGFGKQQSAMSRQDVRNLAGAAASRVGSLEGWEGDMEDVLHASATHYRNVVGVASTMDSAGVEG